MTSPNIIIIGAGIVGATTAFRLAKAGLPVLVIDENAPGSGVTAQSSGWINWICGDPVHDPQGYAQLQASFDHFTRLDADLHGALKLKPRGALRWLETRGQTEAMIAAHKAAGSDVETIDGVGLRTMLSKLGELPPLAAHSKQDLAVDALAMTTLLFDAAKSYGARVETGEVIDAIETKNGRVTGIRAGDTVHTADLVVLAVGTGANRLLDPLGFKNAVTSSPAARLVLTAQNLWSGATDLPIISGPGLEVQFRSADQIVMAKSVPESLADDPDAAARIGASSKRRLEESFPTLRDVRLLSSTIGKRPVATSGNPMLGPVESVEGLYTAIGHPGVILAPMMAQTITDHLREATTS